MRNRRKAIGVTALMLSVAWVSSIFETVSAERIQGNKLNYSPVHMAIVMDSSGSIASPTEENPSDPELISRESAKTLINELPTKENKIALFQYSDTVKRVSDFSSLDNKENIDGLLDSISGMTDCHGGTHMISAITEARKYLEENSEENVKNVIVIFTDGAENGVITPETANSENIANEVKKSIGDSDVIIYSVAFDYLDADGNHSISGSGSGGAGYGKQILDEYAKLTNGKVLINQDNISTLEEQFSAIVEDLCYVDIKNINEFPGDGKEHTTELNITDSVVEADIRISCSSIDAVKNGQIRLYDEKGKEVKLSEDSPDVWYNEDKISANIKIIHPNSGVWKLVVSDVVSKDSIKVNLVEQFNMSLDTSLTVDGSNALDGVETGGTVSVNTHLMSDGNKVTASNLYDDPKTKAAFYVSKGGSLSEEISSLRPEEIEEVLEKKSDGNSVNLKSDGSSFTGEYTFDEPGNYTVSVLVNSENYYCYEDYRLVVADVPVPPFEIEVTDQNPVDSVKFINGESAEVVDLLSYTNDPAATVTVKKYDQDCIAAEISGDKLVINSLSPGESKIVLKYLAADGGSYLDRVISVNVENAAPVIGELKDSYSVSAGDKITIDNISVSDAENDALTYSIRNVSDPSVADITVSDGIVNIDALDKGKTDFELVVSDGTNEVSKMLNVKVTASAKQKALVAGIAAAALAAVTAGILIFLNKSRKLHTNLESPRIEVDVNGDGNFVTVNLGNFFDMKAQFKKYNKITMHQLIKKMIDEESSFRTDLDPGAVDYALGCEALKKIVITGDRSSNKPDIIRCQSEDVAYIELDGLVGLSDGVLCNYGRKITKSISNKKERETLIFFIGGKKDGSEFTKMRVIFTYGS